MDHQFFRSRKMSAAQARAARGLLGWNIRDSAEKAKISRETLGAFENGRRHQQTRNTIARIRRAYERAGVGRLLECAKGCAWQRQLGHAVSYCHTCLVVEASNGDTDRRIRQDLAPGIAL